MDKFCARERLAARSLRGNERREQGIDWKRRRREKGLTIRFLFAYDSRRVSPYFALGGETMTIGQSMLPEFDQEMQSTRKTLERVPDDKWNWKPHDKSGTVGWLAGHIATLPGWTTMTIKTEQLDYAPVNGPAYEPPKIENRKDLLAVFDKESAEARAALAAASDQDLMKGWTLLAGGQTIFTMPRIACIRGMVMNHLIHHRAQLGVYFRLLDVPVPGLYGPSADEGQPNAANA
jgi:uncharacterized damage-inducible protein DinB